MYIIILHMCVHIVILTHSYPLPLQFLDDHPHLFALDPLLLYFFTQAAMFEQYMELLTKVDLYMILTAFLEKIPQYSDHMVCYANVYAVYTASLYCTITVSLMWK